MRILVKNIFPWFQEVPVFPLPGDVTETRIAREALTNTTVPSTRHAKTGSSGVTTIIVYSLPGDVTVNRTVWTGVMRRIVILQLILNFHLPSLTSPRGTVMIGCLSVDQDNVFRSGGSVMESRTARTGRMKRTAERIL